jgi:translation initiation factor 2 beta subunit (eIF-2beta)/eIF-5
MDDDLKERLDALAQKFRKCGGCAEDVLKVVNGKCSKCGGWEPKKAVSIAKKNLVEQTGEDRRSWERRWQTDRRSMAGDNE